MLGGIDLGGGNAALKLQRYVSLYTHVLADQRMCLCGMLAAEFETLPKAMQTALDGFFALNERWLVSVLEEGRDAGTLHFKGPASEAAQYIISSLEGAMMMARSQGAMARFDAATRRLLSEFGS